MKTKFTLASSAAFAGWFGLAAICSAFTPTIPPVISSPSSGATPSSAKPLAIKVNSGDLPNVHSVRIMANGSQIGWAVAPDFLGEWEFPEGAHLSVMKPDPQWMPEGPPIIMDYHPDEDSPMMFFEGDFVSPTRFSGTFETNTMPTTSGAVTVDFTRVNDQIDIVITGGEPLGTRTHRGGLGWHHESTTYTFLWERPSPGVQLLTAEIVHTDPMNWEKSVYATAPIEITIKAPPSPEIDVRQAGRILRDNKSSTTFGRAVAGRKGKSVTYTILNPGNAKLKNLKVTVKGRHAADYLVTQPGKSALSPGAATTFKVRFAPKKPGIRKAQLRIGSNDADENPFRVSLQGTGTSG